MRCNMIEWVRLLRMLLSCKQKRNVLCGIHINNYAEHEIIWRTLCGMEYVLPKSRYNIHARNVIWSTVWLWNRDVSMHSAIPCWWWSMLQKSADFRTFLFLDVNVSFNSHQGALAFATFRIKLLFEFDAITFRYQVKLVDARKPSEPKMTFLIETFSLVLPHENWWHFSKWLLFVGTFSAWTLRTLKSVR